MTDRDRRTGPSGGPQDAVPDRWGGGRGWLGGLGLLLLLVLMILTAHYAGRRFGAVEELIAGLGIFGPLIFVAAYLLITPWGFPVSVFGLAAGAMFGVVGGTLLLTLSAVLAASVIYPLGRRFLRSQVLAYAAVRPRLAAFVALASRDATKLMVLVRLSPLNFALASYLLAAGGVRLTAYLLGTLLVLPSAFLQAYIGSAARHLGRVAGGLETSSRAQDLLTLTGLIVGLILLTVIGNMARKAIRIAAEQELADATDSVLRTAAQQGTEQP